MPVHRHSTGEAKSDREGLADLIDQVRRSKLDAVVTFKLDWLARSPPRLARLIAEYRAHRVALVCSNQGIERSDSVQAVILADQCPRGRRRTWTGDHYQARMLAPHPPSSRGSARPFTQEPAPRGGRGRALE
ncbi:MAG: recombinase family protein [Chthoniobacter sp.]